MEIGFEKEYLRELYEIGKTTEKKTPFSTANSGKVSIMY
jgi:hypothetical protein